MNRRQFASDADYYRAHREAFCFALANGITPKEAEGIIRRQAAAQDRSATKRRLDELLNAPIVPGCPELAHDAAEPPVPWYDRED